MGSTKMNIELDFEVVTLEVESISGGPSIRDKHLNLNVYDNDGQGKAWITSAVITREEMLDFLSEE